MPERLLRALFLACIALIAIAHLEQLLAQAGHPGTEYLGAGGIADVVTYLRTL